MAEPTAYRDGPIRGATISANLFPYPEPSNWGVAWDTLDRDYPWIHQLADCPQDARHHAEGNVWIHLHLVCKALATLPAWRACRSRSGTLSLPRCCCTMLPSRTARARSPMAASPRPAIRAGERFGPGKSLWRLGMPFAASRWPPWWRVFIRRHFTCSAMPIVRKAVTVSQTVRCDLLTLVAEADAQ